MTDARRDDAEQAWARAERDRLLDFGTRLAHPRGGAAWLTTRGHPDPARPLTTWITARMTHVYAIGALLGRRGDAAVASAALAGLHGPLRDAVHGGWHTEIAPDGTPAAGRSAYAHAFVLLAACSAATANLPGADDLLADAGHAFRRFRDGTGLVADEFDTRWRAAAPYRGLNALMHGVEAMLAAWDHTGDIEWRDWAHHATRFTADLVAARGHRLPEHFDTAWTPTPEYNADRPHDPFKPYGATVGHALEWARLLVQVEAVTGDATLLAPAEHLYRGAVADGWSVDGAPGFVYTTDWHGVPIVRDRMHWVVAEALSAAAVLEQRTGDPRYAADQRRWWTFVRRHVVDPDGSWHHQLDPDLTPADSMWPGSPDLYHALTAVLMPSLPLGVGAARHRARSRTFLPKEVP